MNAKQLIAIVAVIAMVGAGIVGAAYAYTGSTTNSANDIVESYVSLSLPEMTSELDDNVAKLNSEQMKDESDAATYRYTVSSWKNGSTDVAPMKYDSTNKVMVAVGGEDTNINKYYILGSETITVNGLVGNATKIPAYELSVVAEGLDASLTYYIEIGGTGIDKVAKTLVNTTATTFNATEYTTAATGSLTVTLYVECPYIASSENVNAWDADTYPNFQNNASFKFTATVAEA